MSTPEQNHPVDVTKAGAVDSPCARLERIAQHTDVIDTATRERLAQIAEEIANGGDWAAVFRAAGVADDGMFQDKIIEEVHDLLDQREEWERGGPPFDNRWPCGCNDPEGQQA